MPRFMVEINRRAYELLETEAKADRRTPQDQAGILLEQMLEAKGDADALAPELTGVTPGPSSGNVQRDVDPDAVKRAELENARRER